MLRSVMVDSLLDRYSEEARFDPWYATFAHPTNTYGKGAVPERIDYLMYRCGSNVKMRTYDFKMPLLMGKDISGRPMSVSDHEGLHVEFIIEKRVPNQENLGRRYKDQITQSNRRAYYQTYRSGLTYDDLKPLENGESDIQLQHSGYFRNKTDFSENLVNNRTPSYISRIKNHNAGTLNHRELIQTRIREPEKATTIFNKKNISGVVTFDKYLQVLYSLNLTSDLHDENFESNRLESVVNSNDPNF